MESLFMSLPIVTRTAKQYESKDGKVPFTDWVMNLRDGRAQAKISKAIIQMEAGNFGDHKSITDGSGLHERRINYGPGYRIYYIIDGDEFIILFAGSDKSNQQKIINQAKVYLADYQTRKHQR
jgi:putative addiction module killer protein